MQSVLIRNTYKYSSRVITMIASNSANGNTNNVARSWGQTLRRLWIKSSPEELESAEKSVLSRVKSKFNQYSVPIDNNTNTINTIHFHNEDLKESLTQTPVLLIHGFGAGLPMWYANLDVLSSHISDLYAIDCKGNGRSSRPEWTAKTTEEAELWFTDSIEQWRVAQNLPQLTIIGHSLGGYAAAVYTMKYPNNVDKLILLSPAGVPSKPDFDRWTHLPWSTKLLFRAAGYFWSSGFTPGMGIKALGPWGRAPIDRYVTKRFTLGQTTGPVSDAEEAVGAAAPMDKPSIANYLYHNFAQPTSGEHALSKILAPGAYANMPLVGRLAEKLAQFTEKSIVFIYGTQDWMDINGGRTVVKELRAAGHKAASLVLVDKAGHQLSIDNPVGFFQSVVYACTFHDTNLLHHWQQKIPFNSVEKIL
jgi:abhydrolase domain-containing protein 5